MVLEELRAEHAVLQGKLEQTEADFQGEMQVLKEQLQHKNEEINHIKQ